jgi:hypothetical protein
MNDPFGLIPEDARQPADVRIASLRAEVLPDGQRVRVYLDLTPFRERPILVVGILDAHSDELARVDIVEPINHRMVFTMHLRLPEPSGAYTLRAVLSYESLGDIDQVETRFEIA